MAFHVPTFPPSLLALVPGAVEALAAHAAASADVEAKQAAIRAHAPAVLAARADVTLPAAKLEALELKHDAMGRDEAAAGKAKARAWERYAAIVSAHRSGVDFESAVAEALPGFDRAAREAWAAFEDAFWSREQAYQLLGSPAPERHYLHRLRDVDAAMSCRPHLDKVAGFVEKFPSTEVIAAALTKRATKAAA